MSEREYYTNLPYTNYCKLKGYEDRMEEQAAQLRIGFYRTHQSLVQKPFTITEFWPLPSDKKVSRDTLFMTKEMKAQIMKAHNLKRLK